MKSNHVFDMTNGELVTKLGELKSELLNLRFAQATGQLTNTQQLNVAKKDIARIKTVLRQRELEQKKKA